MLKNYLVVAYRALRRRKGYVGLNVVGLALGLACYSVAQRTKEVGVRKVLGASEWSIVRLFSADVARLVVVAALVAGPLVWIAAERWLAGYAVRIEPGIATVAVAGGLALALALGTVVALAWRAATVDPVDTLRYE